MWRRSSLKQKINSQVRSKKHYYANKNLYIERTVRRRLKEKLATPKWAVIKAIREFYKNAARISVETGIPHHVDHIYPLQGRNVCGLHVETNLQIISGVVNIAKGNKIT